MGNNKGFWNLNFDLKALHKNRIMLKKIQTIPPKLDRLQFNLWTSFNFFHLSLFTLKSL